MRIGKEFRGQIWGLGFQTSCWTFLSGAGSSVLVGFSLGACDPIAERVLFCGTLNPKPWYVHRFGFWGVLLEVDDLLGEGHSGPCP